MQSLFSQFLFRLNDRLSPLKRGVSHSLQTIESREIGEDSAVDGAVRVSTLVCLFTMSIYLLLTLWIVMPPPLASVVLGSTWETKTQIVLGNTCTGNEHRESIFSAPKAIFELHMAKRSQESPVISAVLLSSCDINGFCW